MTLRLADNTRYTPDFLVIMKDGTMGFHEIKGGYKTPQGWLKFKVAVDLYPFFNWKLVEFKKGEMKETDF